MVDCQPLKKDADKSAFVVSEFKAASRRIEPDAVHALVNAVGANLSELAAACSQLIADAATAVDTAMVDRYYGGRIEATAFKVADAAMAGNGPLALSTLRHALATGADPVPLVAALAAKLRDLAKVAGAQGSSAQIAKQLGMQPWLVEQAQRDVRRWTPEGLVRSIQVTAEADAQVKGESRDPVYAVEHAVTVIAAVPAAGHPRAGCWATHRRPGWSWLTDRVAFRVRARWRRTAIQRMWPAPWGCRPQSSVQLNWKTLECVDLLGDRRLAVCSVVLVKNALADSLIQLTAGSNQRSSSSVLVGGLNGGVDGADGRLQLRLDSVVTQASLLVGEDALLLGLDISHV